ncbi:hypothetical protein BJP34_01195 [Moorena producens PAL-8-15-08-1]|uniref:Uncharacterized protein n=1 Tax=Moorena producens PAL-8-15-08-1 TaxID=1458985 RepID=A0A1D8TKS2_9CYAN|nr:hypothetical protein BJP34_01195 [Moorena producens PAL-8-15-08-1]
MVRYTLKLKSLLIETYGLPHWSKNRYKQLINPQKVWVSLFTSHTFLYQKTYWTICHFGLKGRPKNKK